MDKGLDGSLASHCYICLAWMATGTRVESRPSSLPLHVLVPHLLERILNLRVLPLSCPPPPPLGMYGEKEERRATRHKRIHSFIYFYFFLDMDIPMCDVCDVCDGE